ncbi:MAG: hypothetical protein COB12_10285 [Flavobacterium sp.]|nr:MAG: hypothetical protein COB12_10285 [Flavobacterium sp.]
MYLINKSENRITKLEQKTFSELKFREREHLQEWIANNPSTLGEELLIIQKEFSGFSETNERLDLLALDKFGNLVIIENKLDDSGKDVTWQTIKYASYCSSLTKQEIIKIFQKYLGTTAKSEDKISEFYDNKEIEELLLNQGLNSQRLIMIAAKFRKEVTSSVLWLMNFKIRIQCFKVTPFALNEQLFLNFEQILPIKDTEDFTIGIASKAQEEVEVQETLKNRHLIRINFWEQYIKESNKINNLFSNISPSKDNWIGIGIGMTGVNLNLAMSKNYCRSEIYINRGSKEENKDLFDFIYQMKDIIENSFGGELEWERMDDKVSCRIKSELTGVSYFEKSDWNRMIEFMIDASERMEKAFKNPVKKTNNYIKGKK